MALSAKAALNKDITTGIATMEHRHFATIATILRNMNANDETVAKWANELRFTNPKFNRSRFIAAATSN